MEPRRARALISFRYRIQIRRRLIFRVAFSLLLFKEFVNAIAFYNIRGYPSQEIFESLFTPNIIYQFKYLFLSRNCYTNLTIICFIGKRKMDRNSNY